MASSPAQSKFDESPAKIAPHTSSAVATFRHSQMASSTTTPQNAAGQSQPEEEFEEDASELRFPKEFEQPGCDALIISEVFLLLDHRRKQSESKDDIDELGEVFVKTLDYCRRLSKFKSRETIRAVRGIFQGKHVLHKFEVAQIANLCPENAEEAKSLVPSLENKMDDDEMEELLKDLHAKKTFQ